MPAWLGKQIANVSETMRARCMVRALWRLEPGLRCNPGRGGYGSPAVNIEGFPKGTSSSSWTNSKKLCGEPYPKPPDRTRENRTTGYPARSLVLRKGCGDEFLSTVTPKRLRPLFHERHPGSELHKSAQFLSVPIARR